ncbi:MAG: hypothetical protein QNI91_03190 [Arenicellales bacterium]|nr:hypothetical protein [Arenicellales bacterium]
MRREPLSQLLAVMVVCLLAGCSISTYKIGADNIDPKDVPEPKETQTLIDALARLGPPYRLSATPNGYVLAWEHWHIQQDKLGISLRPIGGDFLSINWGNARTRGDFLVLYFDRNHKLVDSGYGHWDSDAGGGQGIQPLFSIVDVVDVDDLVQPMPHHLWGGFMLSELPITLNIKNHLDTGQNGIQQRGTTANVGQHTLEMN